MPNSAVGIPPPLEFFHRDRSTGVHWKASNTVNARVTFFSVTVLSGVLDWHVPAKWTNSAWVLQLLGTLDDLMQAQIKLDLWVQFMCLANLWRDHVGEHLWAALGTEAGVALERIRPLLDSVPLAAQMVSQLVDLLLGAVA